MSAWPQYQHANATNGQTEDWKYKAKVTIIINIIIITVVHIFSIEKCLAPRFISAGEINSVK